MARMIETEAQGPVWALTSVTVDGSQLLARGGADGMVHLIDARTGQTVRSLGSHTGPVRSLAAVSTETGELLASGGVDGTVRIWDLAGGGLRHEVRFLDGEVWALVPVELGGRTCLAGTGSGSMIQLWDPVSGERLQTLNESGGRIWALAQVMAGDRQLLASGAADGTIRLWDPVNGQVVQTIRGHESTVWALAAVPTETGQLLASGGADGMIRLWNPGSDRAVRSCAGHASTVRALAVVRTEQGTLLASGSADSTVRLWNLTGPAGEPDHTFTEHTGEVWALAALEVDGRALLASGGVDGTVRLVDPATYRTESLLLASSSTVWALATLRTGDRTLLASGGVDGTVRLTELQTHTVERALTGHSSTVRALATVPARASTEETLLASGGADGTVRLWSALNGEPRQVLTGHSGEVWALAAVVVGGQRQVASGGADGTVRLWPADALAGTAGHPRVLGRHVGEVGAVTVLSTADGGQLLASGGADGRVLLWDLAGTGPRAQLDHPGLGSVSALAAVENPAGPRLACALASGGITVWDALAGRQLGELAGSRQQVVRALAALEVSGRILLAAGCQDGTVRLWDPTTLASVGELLGHQGTVRALAGSVQDGRPLLASASDDGEVRLWDLSTRRFISTIWRGARTSTHIVSDRPSAADTLGRQVVVDALHEFLTDPGTSPPIVVGIHGPWGQGKTSVLTQLRARLDPDQPDVGWSELAHPTHRLVWNDGRRPGRLTAWRAWRRFQAYLRGPNDQLDCRLQPLRPRRDQGVADRDRISVWFSPWMYPTREELWAGLARELLTAVTHRVSREQREELWFDLNLRRSDPEVMRRKILRAFVPRSPLEIATAGLAVAVGATALLAEAYLLWTKSLQPVLATFLVGFPVVGLLARLAWSVLRGTVAHVMPPTMLSGPSVRGVETSRAKVRSEALSRDPLFDSDSGYLYLLQHDVRQVVGLATEVEPVVVFIDDLDRCSSEIVSSTIEAINLFMNNAFGECVFVVALDAATIAAHLEVTHEPLRRRIEEGTVAYANLGDVGWRFMEKIVDLPIRLPRVADEAVAEFAAALLTPVEPRPRPVLANGAGGPQLPGPRVEALLDSVTALAGPPDAAGAVTGRRPGSGTLAGTPAQVMARAAGQLHGSALESAVPRSEAQIEVEASAVAEAVELVESIPEVSEALRLAMLGLPRRNPREMKRFLNLWRFYLGLESRCGYLSTHVDQLVDHGRSVAVLVEVMLRWPKYLDRLGERRADRTVLADLLAAATDQDRWLAALERTGLAGLEGELETLRALLASADEEVAELSRRYL